MPELVRYTLSGSIATIQMDDGRANALSVAMLRELRRALGQALADRATVILTGREQRFSAGFDLAVFRQGPEAIRDMLIEGFELAYDMLAYPHPIVAASNGHALAMGSFLLLAADLRVGARGAFKIGANEVAIGMTMPHAALEFCRARVPITHLARVVMTAEIFAPDEALAAGFLDRVVEPVDLPAEALAIATRLSGLDGTAFSDTKRRVREPTLTAVRAGIALDDAELRARD
jgi:enoyl-CoA hydratase